MTRLVSRSQRRASLDSWPVKNRFPSLAKERMEEFPKDSGRLDGYNKNVVQKIPTNRDRSPPRKWRLTRISWRDGTFKESYFPAFSFSSIFRNVGRLSFPMG